MSSLLRCLNRYSVLLIVGLMVVITESIVAQPKVLEPGDRVKIWPADNPRLKHTGTIVEVTDKFVTLDKKGIQQTFPLSLFDHAAVSVGKRRYTGEGAFIGAALGGVVMGVVAVISTKRPKNCQNENTFFPNFPKPSCMDWSGLSFMFGAALGVVVGGVSGLIIGAETEGDRWQSVPMKFEAQVVSSPVQDKITLGPSVTLKIPLK